jgi:hypothetical protein
MFDINVVEPNPFAVEVYALGDNISREEGELSEIEEEDFPSAPKIAATAIVITPLGDLPASTSDMPPPSATARRPDMSLSPIEEERLGAADPTATSDFGSESGQAAAGLLRISLALNAEGSALQSSIRATLEFHEAWLKQNYQKSIAVGKAALNDTRVTDALLQRLKSASLSDDDDEDNDTPKMTAKKDLIRRRKTRRLIEKKKQDSEAKDSVAAPADPLPVYRRLPNHHDFLAVQIFLMVLEDMVIRKDWSSPIEMWVFR